jgi:hypothetical protein
MNPVDLFFVRAIDIQYRRIRLLRFNNKQSDGNYTSLGSVECSGMIITIAQYVIPAFEVGKSAWMTDERLPET